MFHENILLILSLLFAVSMLYMLSKKIKISYPILLVLAGLAIGFIPGMPHVELDPEIVFLIFLPPLLYAAAWNTSWKDFWENRRPISLLSIGLVIFTSVAIAFLSNAIIPDFPLAYGFLLGGIISPPDAVAATSVLQDLRIPKRIVTILEGESLINDASSLIVFRFALAAILTGSFSIGAATGSFFMVAGLGTVIGIALAFIIYWVHKLLPTDANTDTAITLISPYIMYLVAEQFHYSGVMAVVSGGLFLSFRSHKIFAYNTRLQTYAVWGTFTYLLNGLVFILIGLQLPAIVDGLEKGTMFSAILYGLIISAVTIIIRIIWVFPGEYLPRILVPSIRKKEPRPDKKAVFLVAWSGMRGVVSLASALSIPLTLGNGEAFPHRNLLLFITFIVILITLVFQGLSLPWVIKKLNLEDNSSEAEEELELAVRLQMADAVVDYLNLNYKEEIENIEAYQRVKERYDRMAQHTYRRLIDGDNSGPDFLPAYRKMLRELVHVKRQALQRLSREDLYSLEMIREKEKELDLEEARLDEGQSS
ncbi:MAG: Na+/H+ antiporter [Sphingobacteriales bacterium]|nr:MAG: Na+/H+ antiporter [Sphingobacteriales bacterium]